MKIRMAKICAFILTLLSVMIVTGCGEIFRIEVNKKPDDDISRAIYEAVGRKKVYYWGKKSSDSDETVRYEYLVQDYKDENILVDMVKAANAAVEEMEKTEKKILILYEKIPGGYEPVTCLQTYYESEDEEYVQYGSFQELHIYGTEHSSMSGHSPYDKVSTYINLPDIKSLAVKEKIAQNAEEEGIDWYEIWPDLEYYKVWEDYTVKNKKPDDEISQAIYDRLGKKVYYCNRLFNKKEEVLYYFYYVNDYEDENLLVDMAETINEKLKEDDINTRICFVIWETGPHTIATLSNYYEDDAGYESYETLQRIEIWGAYGMYRKYNDVSTFDKLKDIKAVVVEEEINKSMEEQGVDWYEIWPELEHYDIFYDYRRPGYPKVYWIPKVYITAALTNEYSVSILVGDKQ